MKKLITLLMLLWGTVAATANPTFDKLAEVNRCWNDQPDIYPDAMPAYRDRSETAWIKLHLSLVEQTLRARKYNNLSWNQISNRLSALDHLHEYWMAGNFPRNEDYTYRTPIFIDRHNTFCAVGYLVKTSGKEAIARMISAQTNLAYVKDMNYPELDRWAAENGFTKEELAWIQPGYPPGDNAAKVGNGVLGEVKEMLADDVNGKLYVGGNFAETGDGMEVNNVAYVTESNGIYTWHKMGEGVNGVVNAMVQFNGKIYVAGQFSLAGDQAVSNVAYWDGSSWHSSGCTYGTINDLIVYKNELYASGHFDVCAALSEVNIARWNDTIWKQMPHITGRVNTMEVVGEDLVLGGKFTYQNQDLNVIRWNAENDYQLFENSIANEVMDFQMYGDTLYAACKEIVPTQLNSQLMRLNGSSWISALNTEFTVSSNGPISMNTLCIEDGKMMIGGDFDYMPMMGIYGRNFMGMNGSYPGGKWFLVDSTVNKIVRFKNRLFVGGIFKNVGEFTETIVVNGIARMKEETNSIPDVSFGNSINIFPNPVEGNSLFVENNFGAHQLIVTDISGRKLAMVPLNQHSSKQKVSLPTLAQGTYLVDISNEKGAHVTKKIVVK